VAKKQILLLLDEEPQTGPENVLYFSWDTPSLIVAKPSERVPRAAPAADDLVRLSFLVSERTRMRGKMARFRLGP
jgi:hypothetical protein